MATEKVPALRLTLGNAPHTWHCVQDLPGFYHPDFAVPVGGPGEAPLEAAKEASKDPGCAVKLEQISASEAEKTRGLVEEFKGLSARTVRDLTRQGEQNEQIHAEQNAQSVQED